MPYHYTDESRREDPHAWPDVEVFHAERIGCAFCDCTYPDYMGDGKGTPCACSTCSDEPEAVLESCEPVQHGYWYAHGSPGCLWDSEPVGPFDTEAEALEAAREAAGFCPHGVPDEGVCEECEAPELWVLRETGPYGIENPRYFNPPLSPTRNPREACAWASESGARSQLACLKEADRPGYVVGWAPVRLSPDDARRWGKSE